MTTAMSDKPLDDTVMRDCVRALYAQMPQGIVIAVVVGATFVYVFKGRVAADVLWLWYGTICATQFAGWMVWRRFWKMQAGPHWDPLLWRSLYTARAWTAAALLGLMAFLFFAPHFGESRWLTVLTLCGLAAGSITSYAYHPATMYGYLVLLAAPLWWRLVQYPVADSQVAHTIFAFYMGMVAWLGRNQARTLIGSIRIRHENTGLVAQLREKSIALEQASQAKSQFFAAASHDLRQPLHALSYYASLLKAQDRGDTYVERIEQCIGSLDDLLEGVFDISRLDSGRVEAQMGPVAVDVLLRRLASLYEGAAAARGLRLRLRVRPVWAHSDVVLLERVLANLLSNALRYTEQGGVLLTVRQLGNQLRLQILDTGVGIALDAQDRVFDEFVQLRNPQRDANKGVGLGLATVRRLCTLLGHRLSLRSVPGRGSCFELMLPVASAPCAIQSSEPTELHDRLRLQGRALVVDDHTLVRESLVQTLVGWGLECDGAADAQEALSLAGQHTYHAVLCDWRLPEGRDGAEVITAIRAMQPELALAALVTGETAASLSDVAAGILVLRKPIRPLRLRALLSTHLQPLH